MKMQLVLNLAPIRFDDAEIDVEELPYHVSSRWQDKGA
jgi:hypothetical protein